MKISVLGIRGFPDVQGGAEKHAEELYRRLARSGGDITVYTRKPYMKTLLKEWEGIHLKHLWSPLKSSVETLFHTFLGSIHCLFKRPEIVHIHNIGPGLFIPMFRLAGLRVVMTYHSINYNHQKWNALARTMLRLGEYFSLRLADRVIVVSNATRDMLEAKYRRRDLVMIPNGVDQPSILPPGETLKRYNLSSRKYIFLAARFSPEKGVRDLVEAYAKLEKPGFNLVLAGDADQESDYSRDLKRRAKEIPGLVLTGFISGSPLSELYSNAGLFVLPSYSEGMPIALLEAMSYELPVLASDIPQNREMDLPPERYFPVGDIDALAAKLEDCFAKGIDEKEKKHQQSLIRDRYNWDRIAEQTLAVYRSIVGENDH
jgi:glycosyltransferase involved in cell wall biosynthesis